MIEVIYKDEKREAKGNEGMFALPKNIRQIGLPDENYRIYIEDYVYSFLGRAASAEKKDEEQETCWAVFTGEMKWSEGTGCVFIRGAVLLENDDVNMEHAELTDARWQQIHEETEKYFEGQEIVGWFFSQKSMGTNVTEALRRTHQKHFGGEKILMVMDPAEKEEAFYRYQNSFMVKQDGYYIYYEKNPQMQVYMLEKNPQLHLSDQENVNDDAVRAFRKIIQKKQNKNLKETEEKTSVFSYAATACLALAVLAVGVQFYQNYDKKETKETISEAAVSAENITPVPEVSRVGVLTPTSVLHREVTPTPIRVTPTKTVSTESAETEKEKDDELESLNIEENAVEKAVNEKDEDNVYREEADTRKAEQRLRQETEETKSETTSASVKTTYIIKPGDTLYQISIVKYGTMDKVQEICELNGIKEEEIIYPGQIIVLP